MQKQVLFISFLMCTSLYYSKIVNDVPSWKPFNWIEEDKGYTATGTGYFQFDYPVGIPQVSFPSGAAFDTDNHRYVLQITPQNFQWGFANGTYFVNPNATRANCYYEPNYSYLDFIDKYKQVTARSVYGLRTTYTGVVKDPGTCNTTTAITMVQGKQGQVIQYNAQFYLTLVPGLCIPEKLSLTFYYDTWHKGTPNASLFQLPHECFNPFPYCSAYYPCDIQGAVPF
jgi:hypothetical protein